ncbi:MAG: hypothetical protein ACKPCJ_10100, partial [Betaproteobacteria bacterium]
VCRTGGDIGAELGRQGVAINQLSAHGGGTGVLDVRSWVLGWLCHEATMQKGRCCGPACNGGHG